MPGTKKNIQTVHIVTLDNFLKSDMSLLKAVRL